MKKILKGGDIEVWIGQTNYLFNLYLMARTAKKIDQGGLNHGTKN